ncbi:MAG: cell envelope biosis protein TolA [Alphaproteobacteria bacterium]|nr:cell envelope biosis protein TolA [Alphaproteobacteria bacterium]
MARKLKTYLTQSGFYDLAVAAPSMQAALEAWGFTHNVFHQGFAAETDDPDIVAAALAAPGIVLKRAVGTSDPFQEHAAPPKSLPAAAGSPKPASRPKKVPPPRSARESSRAAILSFEKAKAAREEKQAREREALERRQASRDRAVATAEAELEKAQKAHAKRLAALEAERQKIDQRREAEDDAWTKMREKLERAIRDAER